jgi:hypothetical protein
MQRPAQLMKHFNGREPSLEMARRGPPAHRQQLELQRVTYWLKRSLLLCLLLGILPKFFLILVLLLELP